MMNRFPSKAIISAIFVFAYIFHSVASAQTFDCGDDTKVWPYETANVLVYYHSPQAVCENWPDSRIVDFHGTGWIYSHTDVNEFESGASCHYTNPTTRPGFPPIPLNAGSNARCINSPAPDENSGCGSGENMQGNPCNVATGNKFQTETDVSFGLLTFRRSYNSHGALIDVGLGNGWRSNHQKELLVKSRDLTQVSASGRGESWSTVPGSFVWQGDQDSRVIVTQDKNYPWDFTLTRPNGASEVYTNKGRIVSTLSSNGFETTYTYDTNERLSQITNHYGQSLTLSYSGKLLSSITDPLGAVYEYEYDARNNLISVAFPDTTPANTLDNPRKIYHYENTLWPYHLTGISDENGDRYATWAYNPQGQAILNQHAQTSNTNAQERFEFDYQGSN